MIRSIDELAGMYPEPTGRTLTKELRRLDVHCRSFIALSPFAVLATASREGRMDASPRGGPPGFVRVVDDETLWLPDYTGNNRLDSLRNVVETGRAGLLFLIPGVDETLRVNGRARLRADAGALDAFTSKRRPPRTVLEVTVEEAYLHCAKSLMRSGLWDPGSRQDRSVLPPTSQIYNDQTGVSGPAETQEEMVERYRPLL
jgi:PPOX class probable FMN-dependent enzyme